MKFLVVNFFSLNLKIRVMILLAIIIVFFWWALGRKIMWVFSALPFLLRKFFWLLYTLIEVPICQLHKKIGSSLYKLDNGMAAIGQKIDMLLEQWYKRWHFQEKKYIIPSIVVYILLVIWICIPYNPDKEIPELLCGQKVYLRIEESFIKSLEKYGWYEKAVEVEETLADSEEEIFEIEQNSRDIVLVVVTANDPLTIRNIPSIENCETLARVEKGSTVIWKGNMAFGKGSNGDTEPWVEVESLDGTIGWARLKYLCPEDEEDFELTLWVE